jgi:hypothetical protein
MFLFLNLSLSLFKAFVADAADIEEKKAEAALKEQERVLARRSSAVQKELPLPSVVSATLAPAPGADGGSSIFVGKRKSYDFYFVKTR